MSKLDSIWATWAGRAGILAARPDFRLDPAVHGSTSMVERMVGRGSGRAGNTFRSLGERAASFDRALAAQQGVSTAEIGAMVQLVTNGVKLADFRPAGADDAVDIRLRLPPDRRTFAALDDLRVEKIGRASCRERV